MWGSMGTMSDWLRSWENEICGLIPMVGLSVQSLAAIFLDASKVGKEGERATSS